MSTLTRVAVGLGVVGGILNVSMYNVEAGHRAIIFDQLAGVRPTTIGEGTKFRIPFVQRPVFFDVRTRPRRIETMTGTKDMQTVQITLRVLHRPVEERLSDIYSQYGVDYDDRVLPSIGNEVLKAIVAMYDASELITMREHVSTRIREDLTKRAQHFHLVLDDISIVDLSFGREFTQAVEAKQVAQQEAERQRFIVEKAEQEKQAAVIRAEGESSAAKLISESLQKSGMGLIELRRIEAAREIAGTLANSPNVTYLPSNSGDKGGQNLLLQVK